jgi:hypothetical protein
LFSSLGFFPFFFESGFIFFKYGVHGMAFSNFSFSVCYFRPPACVFFLPHFPRFMPCSQDFRAQSPQSSNVASVFAIWSPVDLAWQEVDSHGCPSFDLEVHADFSSLVTILAIFICVLDVWLHYQFSLFVSLSLALSPAVTIIPRFFLEH